MGSGWIAVRLRITFHNGDGPCTCPYGYYGYGFAWLLPADLRRLPRARLAVTQFHHHMQFPVTCSRVTHPLRMAVHTRLPVRFRTGRGVLPSVPSGFH